MVAYEKGLRPTHVKERATDSPQVGFTLSKTGASNRGPVAGWGRPEQAICTPVNMENRLHRDNGEGVAATPLPYPLKGEGHSGLTSNRPDSDVMTVAGHLNAEYGDNKS